MQYKAKPGTEECKYFGYIGEVLVTDKKLGDMSQEQLKVLHADGHAYVDAFETPAATQAASTPEAKANK
jgi:hypothetical protein